MSVNAAVQTPSRVLRQRVVGLSAIALAASMLVQNVVVAWAGAPDYGDPIEQVLAFHLEQRDVVAVAVGLEALNLPLLLGFLTGLRGLVERRGRAGVDVARLALAAGSTATAVLAFYAVTWNGAVLAAGFSIRTTGVFELAWRLHAAAFAFALPALGATLVGAGLAAHASGLTPPWQRLLAVTGGGLLLTAGLFNLVIAEGSALILVGILGYAAWFGWLLATGLRLVRARVPG